MHIILVDDEQKFVTMLAKRLALRGIHADIAFSGDEAIQKAEKNTYDAAVLDLKMPGISGIQLKDRLHDMQPDLAFIFVTGHGGMDTPEKELVQKEIFLSKPLNIDILTDKLNEIAGKG
ncbi:MAG: response regulator [Pseudomonadota bacterium]